MLRIMFVMKILVRKTPDFLTRVELGNVLKGFLRCVSAQMAEWSNATVSNTVPFGAPRFESWSGR